MKIVKTLVLSVIMTTLMACSAIPTHDGAILIGNPYHSETEHFKGCKNKVTGQWRYCYAGETPTREFSTESR